MYSRIILGLLMSLMSIVASAQGVGGHVRRPVTKQQATSTTPAKKRQTQKKESEQKPERKQPESKPVEQKSSKLSSETIIQRLINNMVYVEGGTITIRRKDLVTGKYSSNELKILSFSIGKYEVTQEEWMAVMGNNPSRFKGEKRPVENMSITACKEFIDKLNTITGMQFRLPMETEWYFAARGGNKTKGYKYSGSNNINDVAWHGDNSGRTTHLVGGKSPNELGIYDMSGNVSELCQYLSKKQEIVELDCGGDCWTWKAYCEVGYQDESDYTDIRYFLQSGSTGFRLAL